MSQSLADVVGRATDAHVLPKTNKYIKKKSDENQFGWPSNDEKIFLARNLSDV